MCLARTANAGDGLTIGSTVKTHGWGPQTGDAKLAAPRSSPANLSKTIAKHDGWHGKPTG